MFANSAFMAFWEKARFIKQAAKVFLAVALLVFLAASAFAVGKSAVELRRLAQAGASLVLDLDKTPYTAVELEQIASSLASGCTLTIICADAVRLTTSQCLQIIRARPGQIVFWFGR